MHPDQTTPPDHRYTASDSAAADAETDPTDRAPDADQDSDAIDAADDASAEVEDGARVAEAGNAYVGRMMDDDLKSSPRVEDGDAAVDRDPSTPGDD